MSVMRRFVWFVFLFHGFAVAQVPPDSYFTKKEEQVRKMAAEIVKLDEARCDWFANCSSSCSRHVCTPIDGFHDRTKYNFTCQQQRLDNPHCPFPRGGGYCNSRQVNYGMSYFRMSPHVKLSDIPDGIPDEMCSTICMTRNFTSTVRALAYENDYAHQVDELFQFGSIDGIFRSYPGEVITIGDDNGTIADGNGSGVVEKSKTYLHGLIDKIKPSDSETAGSTGFVQAITAAFQRINNIDDDATVILVFTDGGFASDFQPENIHSVSQMLNNHSTKLFIYSFEKSLNLESLAKESGGYFEIVENSFDNPLYQISSVFNFMALARNATSKEPFWTKFYKDFDGRGNIITVSYQALSPKGRLVGVAGIDISFKSVQEGLPPAIQEKSGHRPTKSRNLMKAPFKVQSTNNSCGSCKGAVQAVCPRSSSKSFTELECCDTCHSETHKWRSGKIIAAPVVLGVVVLALIIGATWWWRRRRERSRSLKAMMTDVSSVDVGPYR